MCCIVLGVAKSDMIDRLSLSTFLSPETLPTHTIGGILCAKGLQPQKSSLPLLALSGWALELGRPWHCRLEQHGNGEKRGV